STCAVSTSGTGLRSAKAAMRGCAHREEWPRKRPGARSTTGEASGAGGGDGTKEEGKGARQWQGKPLTAPGFVPAEEPPPAPPCWTAKNPASSVWASRRR